MLNFSGDLKIHAYTGITDMRKGFNGLSGLVREEFGADPTDGSLFIFINRRRDRMKLLHFDGGGYWLYYRLLEAGTFEALKSEPGSCRLRMDATEPSMLLSGVSLLALNRTQFIEDACARPDLTSLPEGISQIRRCRSLPTDARIHVAFFLMAGCWQHRPTAIR